MSTHAFPILFLPGFVGQFFRDDGRARSDHLMDKLPVQALAMSSQSATSFLVSATVMPAEFSLLDAAFCIIILWVIGSSLPVQFSLETPFLLLVGFEFLAKREQACLPLFGDNSDGRGAKTETNGGRSHLMPGFQIGNAFQSQLDGVAIALTISPLRL
jgi:hypothetical protein